MTKKLEMKTFVSKFSPFPEAR